MHLIYRSKKQTLPIVNDNKLSPYLAPVAHQSPPSIFQKKSIEILLDKHITPFTPSSQTLCCYKPQRKTLYKGSKTRKADSEYLKIAGRGQHSQSKRMINRNKSTHLVQKSQGLRRRDESQYYPYMFGQKKSRSVNKLKMPMGEQIEERDWICARLIEKQVYSLDEGSDFC